MSRFPRTVSISPARSRRRPASRGGCGTRRCCSSAARHRRIVTVGHMDGGPAALLAAAAREEIDGVVTIDAAGASGAELILLQQQKLLDDLNLTDADRQARIELQKKIQAAVMSGAGWEGVPAPMRRQADTPWFKSVLSYDP